MSRFSPKSLNRLALIAVLGATLSACVSAYSERDTGDDAPLKGLAAMGGLTTTVPEAKDFVKESRPENLNYIPVGVQPDELTGKKKTLTPEELLLLQKKLDAERKQNDAVPLPE